ncbi:3-ketoacyl-ACP reductase [Halobacillus shinanisalinarum]|uniref:3-ketoacyl-ACP reductase n=1 Tax=Halobacillus shinanisalinarum TaxID=2932258 RepID=A0ABY4H4Z9_9BACI|nr:3-ketoacyl-ACP reductase [Halobacillus shinanisalinarum]UOQ95424.1 3-ketoacyl-ACP reductase [Halobacillus shinanisalinarum]
MQSLQGKTALITGAGRGIGRATAIALAKEGVHVGLVGLTEANLEKVSAELESVGINISVASADVSDIESVNQAVKQVKSDLGSIDILINNAGIGKYGGFMDLNPEEWEKVIQVNLMGTYYVSRAVLPGMIEQKSGDIVNISSTSGLRGTANSSAYSASKFGILGLSESLMQEVRKHNIRVNAITPSRVATNFTGQYQADEETDHLMQPEDLAEYIISQLKLNPRTFVKSASLWATNPF